MKTKDNVLQVAFIEELQRRLTPVNGKALPLHTSKSSPVLAHVTILFSGRLDLVPSCPSREVMYKSHLQVAFIEELQRRLTPVNGKALPLHTSKSSPILAHDGAGGLPPAAMDDMRGAEHKSPFELRALEVALDVVSRTPLYASCEIPIPLGIPHL